MSKPSLAQIQGGKLGEHARYPKRPFELIAPFVFGLLTLNQIVLMLRQIPCIKSENRYLNMCYTDIPTLFLTNGWANAPLPFWEQHLEYPTLTSIFIWIGRAIQQLFTGSSPDINATVAAGWFYGVNAFLLFCCFGVLLATQLRLSRPRDAIMIAVSPAILTAGLINWDALVLALTGLAVLAWARKNPLLAGVFLGLGISAKLYPLLLLIPLAVLCLRASKWKAFFMAVGGTLGSWLLVNVPAFLLNQENWLYFWTFNVDRGADLGSFWYMLQLAGYSLGNASHLETILLVLGTFVICMLLLFAPRRPRFAQGAFLVVAWFLIVNKVYSPQYVLWLLPLLVMARPRWLDWTIFSIAETGYFAAIWIYLHDLENNASGTYPYYWFAILFRVAVQLWLMGRVIHDIFRPERDIIRVGDLDDPDGGILDGSPDASWVQKLRRQIA